MKVAKFATLVALIYSSITLLYTANADDSPPPNIVTTIDTRQTCPSGTIPVIQKSNLVCIYIIDLFDFGSGGFAGVALAVVVLAHNRAQKVMIKIPIRIKNVLVIQF